MSSKKNATSKTQKASSSSEDSSQSSDSSTVKTSKGKNAAPKVVKTSRKNPEPEPKGKSNKDSSSSASVAVTKVKITKKATPPPKRSTPAPKKDSSSSESEDESSKKKKTSTQKKEETSKKSSSKKKKNSSSERESRKTSKTETKRERSTSRPAITLSAKEDKRAKEDMENWDQGTVAVMKLFGKVDTSEIKSKNVRTVRRNLSLNFSETPLTPLLLKKYFSNTKVGIVGINILLSDETTLEIPEVLHSQLRHIVISGEPTKLTDVSVLGECKDLQYLSLTDCTKLKDLTELGNLEFLEEINLSGCSSLPSLRSSGKNRYYFRKSAELHVLNLGRCESLTSISGIETSKRLEYLNVSYCGKLESILEISSLTALTTLDAAHCTSLSKESITALDMLNNVNQVNIHKSSLDGQVRIVPREVTRLTIGNFNMLARGLEQDFFLCSGGEEKSVNWKNRGPKVFNVIAQMMQSCNVVVVEENDYFFPILSYLQETIGSHIKGVFMSKTTPPKTSGSTPAPTNARMFRLRVMLEECKPYLNEEDTKFLEQTLAASPPALKGMVDRMYMIVNDVNKEAYQKGNYLFDTYRIASRDYGSALASFYGRDGEDVYVEDDGIGFYYDSNAMSLTEVTGKLMLSTLDAATAGYGSMVNHTPFFFNKDGWLDVDFTYAERSVTILGAHLTSGEALKNENERYATANRIVSALQNNTTPTIPFLVMDSNVSPEYEAAYPSGTPLASSVFSGEAGFYDAVPIGEYPCFKERSNLSTQKDKRCELIFDQIDKMYYLPTAAMNVSRGQTPLHEFGFLRFPPSITQEVHNIRTNDALRAEQKTICMSKDTDAIEVLYPDPNSPFRHIYPGPNSPSDHPPIAITFILLAPITTQESKSRMLDVTTKIESIITEHYSEDFNTQQMGDYYSKNMLALSEARNVLLAMPASSLDDETYTRVMTEKGLFQKL